MGISPIGTVVLIKFPYADFKLYKKRPAVIVAHGSLKTVILCQVTSRLLPDVTGIPITMKDFLHGNLPVSSYARPDKLFTIDSALANESIVGHLTETKVREIRKTIQGIFA